MLERKILAILWPQIPGNTGPQDTKPAVGLSYYFPLVDSGRVKIKPETTDEAISGHIRHLVIL